MVLFRARSIRQLTIIGFLAVAALLIAALLVTARQLDQLSDQSQATVAAAATAMSASRQLIEQTLAMERNALQYVVLRDDSLYQVYSNRRAEFQAAAAQLRSLNASGDVAQLPMTLLDTENAAFTQLTGSPDRATVEAEYARLSRMAYEMSDAIEAWIGEQQSQLRERSDSTKQALTLQALLFIAAASGLAVMFIVLITRPLQQIDSAINRLGSGAYDSSILITGPRDLQSLGLRLDWLRSRLGELEQQRSSFLRHVSHELKTPLASMQEGAALLNEGVVGPLNQEQREISRIIVNNCQRLQGLIEDLLRHNSQNFEVLNAMPEPVRFDNVIERVVDAHQLAITSGRNKVQQELEKLVVLADPERLRVIIDNLFTNALKFSPEDGVITLKLFASDDLAIFEITDEGPGVPQEEWTKIFAAFYQGSVRPRRAYNGTGLGLAIAREYVLAGGGSIELCEANKGACFRVTLPLPRKLVDDSKTME
ncbi:MAG: HAMP domain-containing sensor histidine kinase [Gammaproteobacteria bacterium]|nr:HAMP domain-containing sensor histidine kinase [Gammaproteobacteria bacterium]